MQRSLTEHVDLLTYLQHVALIIADKLASTKGVAFGYMMA